MKKQLNLKVCFCPAHYTYDEIFRGSELSWVFNIVDKLSKYLDKSLVVTGFKSLRNDKKYRIIELQKNKKRVDLSLKNSVIFNIKYSFLSFLAELSGKFNIIHHTLPFGMHATFDIFKILYRNKKVKYIIGPIQSSLPEYKDNVYDFDCAKLLIKNNRFKQTITKFLFKITKFLSQKTLLRADKIIVIDKNTKNELLKQGIPLNKIKIIHPGIDAKKFPYPKKKKYYYTSRKLKLITAGSLISRKGVTDLIKVVSLLVKKNIKVHLTVIGDGPQKKKVKSLVKFLKLKKYVSFLGFINHEKINRYYRLADLFVTMSKNESWGQVYLEAMASGLPIVSSLNDGAKNIIDSSFGFLVNGTDAKKFADIIEFLASKPKLLKKMSLNARKKIKTSYDWEEKIIKKYIVLYQEVI